MLSGRLSRLAGVGPLAMVGLLRAAGWSSSVARWAHNPEVAGSNPVPATNVISQEIGDKPGPLCGFGFCRFCGLVGPLGAPVG